MYLVTFHHWCCWWIEYIGPRQKQVPRTYLCHPFSLNVLPYLCAVFFSFFLLINRLKLSNYWQWIGSMHSGHFGKKLGPFFTSFTGVTNDTNEGSVPFWSNALRVPWGGSKCPLKKVCNSESVQMEPNGPLRVHLVPFVHSQSYGGFENHCATLNGTEPSLVPLVTPVKELRKGPKVFPKWLLRI